MHSSKITIIIKVSEDFSTLPFGVSFKDSSSSLELFLDLFSDTLKTYENIIIDFTGVLRVGSNFLKYLAEYITDNNLENNINIQTEDVHDSIKFNKYLKQHSIKDLT